MLHQLPQILQVKPRIQGHHIAVALRAGDVPVCRLVPVAIGLPDLVAASAGLSSRVAVVEARARQEQYRAQDHEHRRKYPKTNDSSTDHRELRAEIDLAASMRSLPGIHQVLRG